MKKIMLDIDGVLADFETAFRHAAETFGGECTWDGNCWLAAEHFPKGVFSKTWDIVLNTPWWWTSLKPCTGLDTFRRIGNLCRENEVYFITNRMHNVISPVEQTATWLRQQGIPHPAVICTHSKGAACRLLKINYAIEDKFENALDISFSKTRSYLLNRPWNQQESNTAIYRVDTVHEFLDRVDKGD